MRAPFRSRMVGGAIGLLVIAGAVWLAARLPGQHCTYRGDSGLCEVGNPLKIVVVVGVVLIGGGVLAWAARRGLGSTGEAGAA
jgi:hypothetical protein